MFFASADEWRVLALAVRTDSCAPDGLGFAVYLRPYQEWIAGVVRAWTGHEPPAQGGVLPGTPGPAVTATPLPSVTASPTASPSPRPSRTPTVTATSTPTATPAAAYLPWTRRR